MISSFFAELKRRNVLKVAGFYIGVGLMLLEGGDILVPMFGWSDAAFQIFVYLLLAGFPVMVVISWFFELTSAGLLTDEDAQIRQAAPLFGGRKSNYAVIGILGAALTISLLMNFVSFDASPRAVPTEPISILIADFRNSTSEHLFTGALEEALQIGIEGASFITSFPRAEALEFAKIIRPDLVSLDTEHARLVAVQQGINLVLAGDALPDGSGYEIRVTALEPGSGETIMEASVKAKSKLEVLDAISRLSTDVREALGDVTVEDESYVAETFRAASIEAVGEYLSAQRLAGNREFAQAVVHYQRATELDPILGRAYSGWALATFKLGQPDKARELWERALELLGTMSQRERYRTLGPYYALSNQNYQQAVDTYRELVEKFPADGAGYNNLAVTSFLMLDFAAAEKAGAKALEVYPKSFLYRSNYALYAMYASEFEKAAAKAEEILAESPDFVMAYLPIALASIDRLDFEEAERAYDTMAGAGEGGMSLAYVGLADLAMYRSDFARARRWLEQGIADDDTSGNVSGAATKRLMLASIEARQNNVAAAGELLSDALSGVRSVAKVVPAAMVHIQLNQLSEAELLSGELELKLQPQIRAYGHGVAARIAFVRHETNNAIDELRVGMALADIWWLHLLLGEVYLEAGYFAEALSEFESCYSRRGEGVAVFLDDVPTVRELARLPYLIGQAQQELGMHSDAAENYQRFLALKSDMADDLVVDAKARLAIVTLEIR